MLPVTGQADGTSKRQHLLRYAVFLIVFSAFCTVTPAHAQYWTGYVPGATGDKPSNPNICCACKGPQDTDSNSCLTVAATKLADPSSCATLPTLSDALKGWTCQTTPLGEPGSGKCRPVPQNGICKSDPRDAFTAGDLKSATGDTKNFVPDSGPAIIPKLNVQIPGFAFTGSAVNDESSSLLAQYVAGAYRYLISISAVAATVMFTFGAFLYLLGGAMPSINSGKRIMQEAVIGMLLVLSATLILRTINPDTLTLSALHITGVKPERAIFAISAAASNKLYGGNVPSRAEMLALGKTMAEKTGIPELPCIVFASMSKESGGRMDVIGHDENFQSANYLVKSRTSFLQSGLKYSKATFTPVACDAKECQTDGQLNDDTNTFDPSAPPDYGIDWRYSHGFGASQSTIFPSNKPCEGREEAGRGFRMAGKCYTVPELMTPEGNVGVMVEHFKAVFLQTKDPAKAFVAYAGNITVDNPAIVERMATYNKCHDAQK